MMFSLEFKRENKIDDSSFSLRFDNVQELEHCLEYFWEELK